MLALNSAGQNYAYLYDGKGNVEAVLDNTQAVAAAYRYDPFGVLLNQTGSLTQPYGFSTKRYDAQTGMIQYEYRNYFPSIARWGTRDPLGEAGGMNLYAFVGNNPVNWVDPFGLTRLSYIMYDGMLFVDPEIEGKTGYWMPVSSGRNSCLNNPSCERTNNEGPIPSGEYFLNIYKLTNPGFVGDILRNTRGDWGDWRTCSSDEYIWTRRFLSTWWRSHSRFSRLY